MVKALYRINRLLFKLIRSFKKISDKVILRSTGNRESWKKAIVTLKDGDKINLVDGDFS